MQCQLLRDDDTISASAGRYRGKLDALTARNAAAASTTCPA
jgi:hypothetical protein